MTVVTEEHHQVVKRTCTLRKNRVRLGYKLKVTRVECMASTSSTVLKAFWVKLDDRKVRVMSPPDAVIYDAMEAIAALKAITVLELIVEEDPAAPIPATLNMRMVAEEKAKPSRKRSDPVRQLALAILKAEMLKVLKPAVNIGDQDAKSVATVINDAFNLIKAQGPKFKAWDHRLIRVELRYLLGTLFF